MEYTQEMFEKLSPLVDEDILQLWASGSYLLPEDDYFRLVNPLEVLELMSRLYEDHENAIPVLSTAFGDLIVFQNGTYIVLRFRDRVSRIVGVKLEYLLTDLKSDFYRKEMFNPFLFAEVSSKVGAPAEDKQFVITPLPAEDGTKSATIKFADLLATLEEFADANDPLPKAD